MPTNNERAEWADEALKVFARRTGLNLEVEADDAIGDLICDLLHLAKLRGFDAHKLHARGKANFEHEQAFPDE